MKLIVTSIAACGLLASLATAQEAFQPSEPRDGRHRYTVKDLGPVDNPFSQAAVVNNAGLVAGVATAPDGATHAVLWRGNRIKDIGTPGFNSAPFGLNERGQVVGQTEIQDPDPNRENFCQGYRTELNPTNFKCVPFLWQDGVMTQLPTLGGNNGWANSINNRGEIAGAAESTISDPSCAPAVNGTGPQVLRFEAVVWGPRPGHIRRLRPLRGDTVGMAFWINNSGQAVGSSGSCASELLPPFVGGEHAVLWDSDGSVHDLGNLGGAVNTASLGIGNHAFAINNRGQVVGGAAQPGATAGSPSTTNHAFLWTRETGMQDLGTLDMNSNSAGFAINERGEVVGISVAGNVGEGFPSAFLWRNGEMFDLNALIPAGSPLHLAVAAGINEAGEIAGFGFTADFAVHAFLAVPSDQR